jgi:hypothetical protein
MSINIPSFLRALNHLSPLSYAVRNMAPYSLRGITFTCSPSQQLPDGQCAVSTGEQVLELYNLNTNPGLNIMALGVCAVVYRLVAYVLLKFLRTRWGELREGNGRGFKKFVGCKKDDGDETGTVSGS